MGGGFTCQMWTSSQMIAEDNKLATCTTYTQCPQDGHDTHYAGHSHAVDGDAHTGCRPSSAWQRGSHLQVAYMCRWTTQQGSARLTGLPCKGIVDETYNTDLHLRAMSNNMLRNTMQTEHIHTWCLWNVFEIRGWQEQLWTWQILPWRDCLNTESTNTRG